MFTAQAASASSTASCPCRLPPIFSSAFEVVRVRVDFAERVLAADDDVNGFGGRVGDVEESVVFVGDVLRLEDRVLKPRHHPAPVLFAEEDDGEVLDLARLDERERLEHLVERAVAAGED